MRYNITLRPGQSRITPDALRQLVQAARQAGLTPQPFPAPPHGARPLAGFFVDTPLPEDRLTALFPAKDLPPFHIDRDPTHPSSR